jgi:hypothetical protein
MRPAALTYDIRASKPGSVPTSYTNQAGGAGHVPLSRASFTVPSPEPGPPPPEITPFWSSNAALATSGPQEDDDSKPGYGFVDTAVLEALEAQAEYNQRLVGRAADPALMQTLQAIKDDWLADQKQQREASVFADPGLADAQQAYDRMIHQGFADPAVAEAQQSYKDMHPWMFYPIDLTPDDDGNGNPYGIDIDALLRVAIGQLGYREKASNSELNDRYANSGDKNYTKYTEMFNMNGVQWCAAFASWCAEKAGIPKDKIFQNTSTNGLINSYMDAGRFRLKESYIPKAGDLILLQTSKQVGEGDSWSYGNAEYNEETGQFTIVDGGGQYHLTGHTGIVIGYHDKYVYTIEGNGAGNAVSFGRRELDSPGIKGYGVNGGSSSGFIPPELRK